MCSSSSTSLVSAVSYSSTPVASRQTTHQTSELCLNYSAPQCCHCGYRGQHADACPFNPNPQIRK
ncbi:hypothetical protein CPB83DRAFT_854911 [Crepidotus variabilis]|uniref:Uncharacterized protein n=1 Tax=Crepidotus variabilis TaxID=179855 RepID=A0A9P6EEM8_9AGAR|nr:hypothetical protein CPB83DRAFT_854911 [Crepidotus variabilis]